MMNPMPMPNGPTEIPGGLQKSERQTAIAARGGTAKQGTSFASTLKAVHDQQGTQEAGASPATDGPLGEEEKVGEKDGLSGSVAEGAATGDNGDASLVMPEAPGETSDTGGILLASGSEMAPDLEGAQAEPGGPEERAVPGALKRMAPQTGRQFQATQDPPQKGDANHPQDAAVDDVPVAKAPPKETAPGSSKTAESASTATGAAPNPAEGHPKAAGTILHAAPERPEAKRAEGPLVSVHHAAEQDGRNRTGGLTMPGEGKEAQSETPETAKQVSNRGTTNHQGDSRVATPQPMPAAPSEAHSDGASAGEGGSEQQRFSNGAGRETLLTAMKDDPGQALPRQGSTDAALPFSTTAPTAKGETPSPATPMPAAAERFHQDNFQQLVERAVFTLRGEQSEARIALKPDQLGHVHMRIVTDNQAVSIKILTESAAARDLIDAGAHQLKSELQQQGLTVESIEVSVSDDPRDAYRGARQREAFMRQLASQRRRETEEEPPTRGDRFGRPSSGRGRAAGIDYFA